MLLTEYTTPSSPFRPKLNGRHFLQNNYETLFHQRPNLALGAKQDSGLCSQVISWEGTGVVAETYRFYIGTRHKVKNGRLCERMGVSKGYGTKNIGNSKSSSQSQTQRIATY